MSQDINYIKKQLINCEEVNSPFDLKVGDHVKYITINEDEGREYYYDGGKYKGMGNNEIIIMEGGRRKKVPITIINNLGEILYSTRFFLDDNSQCTEYSASEYEKIIKNQQKIIEILTRKVKNLERGDH